MVLHVLTTILLPYYWFTYMHNDTPKGTWSAWWRGEALSLFGGYVDLDVWLLCGRQITRYLVALQVRPECDFQMIQSLSQLQPSWFLRLFCVIGGNLHTRTRYIEIAFHTATQHNRASISLPNQLRSWPKLQHGSVTYRLWYIYKSLSLIHQE